MFGDTAHPGGHMALLHRALRHDDIKVVRACIKHYMED